MIVESIILGVTVITCSSLWLADRVHKREISDPRESVLRDQQAVLIGELKKLHSYDTQDRAALLTRLERVDAKLMELE